MEKLVCSCGNFNFIEEKKTYICKACGNRYNKKRMIYCESDVEINNEYYSKRECKGRKVYCVDNNRIAILNKKEYVVINMGRDNLVEANFEITNNAVEVICVSNRIIEFTYNKKINIYDSVTKELLRTIKKDVKFFYTIENGILILDNKKLCLYDFDFTSSKVIFDFGNEYGMDIYIQIKNVSTNNDKSKICLFYTCMQSDNQICGSIYIDKTLRIENRCWEHPYKTIICDFENKKYIVVENNVLFEMDENEDKKYILSLPKLESILDGGISYPEIFIEYPKNIKCCNEKYYFIFDSAFLVIDSKDKGVIYCYIDDRHNLIQSFEVNSEDMIFFSVGNKSYILEKTYEEMYS